MYKVKEDKTAYTSSYSFPKICGWYREDTELSAPKEHG